jgi:hypothetical protein
MAGLMIMVMVAGCIGGGEGVEAPPEPTDVKVDKASGKGSVFGIVVDSEQAPVGGVIVGLVEAERETTTVENGTFVFNDVEPGSYAVVAQRLGYDSVAHRVTVKAGEAVETTFELTAIQIVDPYHETQRGDGFMTCQWSTPAVKSRIACNEIGDDEKSVFEFPVQTHLIDTLTETTWEQSSALSPEYMELDHIFDDDCKECNVIQKSPHRHLSEDYDDIEDEEMVVESYWLPFGNASQPLIFAFQQKFTVHMTAFYGEGASPGFSAIE